MKRIIAIMIMSLFTISALAQTPKSIYKRYSNEKDVSAVYISPTMFEMMKELPKVEVGNDEMEFSNLISSFKGMYILNMPAQNESAEKLLNAVNNYIKRGVYELLMEAKNSGDNMNIYVARNGDTITEFVMVAKDAEEVAFIAIEGNFNRKKLTSAIGMASK